MIADHNNASLLEIGEIIYGRGGTGYKIEFQLEKKGNERVFMGRRIDDNIPVVCKVLPTSENAKQLMRFIREADIVLEMQHDNIVRGFDFYNDTRCFFLIMECISGSNVEEMLDQSITLPLLLATEIVYQISLAIEYLSSRHVVHRDIKPSNIVWSEQKVAKLVDFGAAVCTDESFRLTTKGYVLGTPSFMSPEQISGGNILTSSDIYSLGATWYLMVSGSAPFVESKEFLRERIQRQPKRVDKINPQIPKYIADLLEEMMRPEIRKRISIRDLPERLGEVRDKLQGHSSR